LRCTRAHGIRLPKGWSGQQGEAFAGWLFLKLAKLSRRKVVWMITDSEAVCALIQSVHLNPLKAHLRHLSPWVPLYNAILSGWAADVHVCRQSSHGLSQQIQESDRAAAHEWEICRMWKRSALRVELQQLGAPFSHRHKEVVRRACQQVLTLQYAENEGPSSRFIRGKWPTPWRTDVHILNSTCSAVEKSRALQQAVGRLPDFEIRSQHFKSRSGVEVQPTCVCSYESASDHHTDSAHHYIFCCR
jgi:hypothetical protein